MDSDIMKVADGSITATQIHSAVQQGKILQPGKVVDNSLDALIKKLGQAHAFVNHLEAIIGDARARVHGDGLVGKSDQCSDEPAPAGQLAFVHGSIDALITRLSDLHIAAETLTSRL